MEPAAVWPYGAAVGVPACHLKPRRIVFLRVGLKITAEERKILAFYFFLCPLSDKTITAAASTLQQRRPFPTCRRRFVFLVFFSV